MSKSTAMMNDEDHGAWEATVEILRDADTMIAIRRADEDLASGNVFSLEQVFGYPQPKSE